MRLQLALTAFLAGCVFFHDPDGASTGPGSGGASTTNAGAGASGGPNVVSASTSGGTSAGGSSTGAASAGGSGGCGGADTTTDPTHCGACNWDCGTGSNCTNGVCSAISEALDGNAAISSVAVIGTSVLAQRGASSATIVERRSLPLITAFETFNLGSFEPGTGGVGFLARTPPVGSNFLYAPQKPAAPPALARCMTAPTCELVNVRDDINFGTSIAVGHVNGLVAKDTTLFVLNSASPQLAKVEATTCFGGGNCELQPATGAMLDVDDVPISALAVPPVGLDLEDTPGQPALWWTTFNGSGAACVYRWPITMMNAEPVRCALELPGIHRLSVAGSLAFVGLGGSAGDGEIHRVVGPNSSLSSVALKGDGDGVTWPADTDENVLYAFDRGTPRLVALRVEPDGTAMALGWADLHPTEMVKSVDASHPSHVVFSTFDTNGNVSRIYSWRKPAAGY